MKKAKYTNRQTNEVYIIGGISDLGQAWGISLLVCDRNGWNSDTFAMDVKVELI